MDCSLNEPMAQVLDRSVDAPLQGETTSWNVHSAIPAFSQKPPAKRAKREPDKIEDATDRDIIFAVLSRVLPWTQASTAAEKLMQRYGSLPEILGTNHDELASIEELGPFGASLFGAIHAAVRRAAQVAAKSGPIMRNWEQLLQYLQIAMARETDETVRVLFLDTRNRVLSDEILAKGDIREVNITPRAIIRRALCVNATAFIMAHNHPSGDPTPSATDIDLTARIRAAAEGVGLAFHDHLIIGRGQHTSFRRMGLM